jgi:hypothetical protein
MCLLLLAGCGISLCYFLGLEERRDLKKMGEEAGEGGAGKDRQTIQKISGKYRSGNGFIWS